MAERVYPKLSVFDMDRTLINSSFATLLFGLAVSKIKPEVRRDLHLAHEETERTGGSFGARNHLVEQNLVSQDEIQAIDAQFIELGSDPFYRELLVPRDTDRFLHWHRTNRFPHLILTQTDSDYRWQELKMQAAGLARFPHIIAPARKPDGTTLTKGELVAGWKNDEGVYVFPEVATETVKADMRTRRVALFDDKGKSFRGLPTGNQAFWVQRGAELLVSQQVDAAELHPDVQVIRDFSGVNLQAYLAA